MDYLCTKHGIEYFLTGGTLQGAIRFKGNIPWDDDMDIGMTRENYENLFNMLYRNFLMIFFFKPMKQILSFPHVTPLLKQN